MMELLRRLWRAVSYDPQAEYQRAKELLARRLASSEISAEAERAERPKAK